MKQEILQHILFPDDESLSDYWKLYYRGERGRLVEKKNGHDLRIGADTYVEFNTYLNGLSFGKWKEYTGVEQIRLCLDIEGRADILLCGYSMEKGVPVRKVLKKQFYDSKNKKEAVFDYPKNTETILGFEISAQTEVVLHGGHYEGVFLEESERAVELALSTTTFQKEDFVRRNTRRIKEGLFDRYPEVGEHIRMHVVDNGRSLVKGDVPEDGHFVVHPNPNTGGSGGFARGMIESLYQSPRATHVLLMDDDILILPESIYRTYQLLRYVKDEYSEYFVSGAMLRLEEKNKQHEGVGSVQYEVELVAPEYDHFKLKDSLKNEGEYFQREMYQAWWYCCIPVSVILKNGLPLPLFIRIDDVEYGLRCKARMLSMNGICVWHMGFYGKYKSSMEVYQNFRNLLICRATIGGLPQVETLMKRLAREFRTLILKHDYAGAEIWLRAIEDFMKGPRFIMEDRGEEIVRENGKLNEQPVPFEGIEDGNGDLFEAIFADSGRNPIKKMIYRITFGGHMLWPDRWLDPAPTMISYGMSYVPGKMGMKRTYIAVDPIERQMNVRPIDRKKFFILMKRFIKDMLFYRKNKERLCRDYLAKKRYLTSERFWRKYLGIM